MTKVKNVSKMMSLFLAVLMVLCIMPAESFAATDTKALIPTTGWVWPVPENKTILSPYTYGNALAAKRSNHTGIDISKNAGLLVVAARAGTVVAMCNKGTKGGTACFVTLKHSENGIDFYSTYYHLKSGSVCVKIGDSVRAGQKLGITGDTGKAEGVHLHFGVSTKKVFNEANLPYTVNVNPKDTSLITSNNSKYSNKEICTGGNFVYTYNDDALQLAAYEASKVAQSTLIRITQNINLKASPNASSANLGTLSANEVCRVISSGKNKNGNCFLEIETAAGKTGYISKTYAGALAAPTISKISNSGGYTVVTLGSSVKGAVSYTVNFYNIMKDCSYSITTTNFSGATIKVTKQSGIYNITVKANFNVDGVKGSSGYSNVKTKLSL